MSGFAALLVVAWVAYTRRRWSTIGFVWPRSWWRTIWFGLVAGVVLKLLMKSVVMPLLGADPHNAAYQHLVGNPTALPGILFTVVLIAGVGEEIFWRGFLFDRFVAMFGARRAGASAVLLSSILFALAHLADQGRYGAAQAIFTGIVFGTAYRIAGNLWLPIAMHIAFDITAVLIIYVDLEMAIATLVFP
jgi:membrane protease YdiL (CAAX protease family)